MLVVIISIVVTYLSYVFEVAYNIDLTLLSIAVIFPLVFAIRGSFRRREKALEHLSQFRSSITTIVYLVKANTKISDEHKVEIYNIFNKISEQTIAHLRTNGDDTKRLDGETNAVFDFITENIGLIPGGLRERIFRLMENMHESIENLHGIHIHRTPISLKAYCMIFIYLFPIVYAPALISTIGLDEPQWVTYVVVILSEFILVSLYNIQDQLEYPFDSKGLDDIKLEVFKLNR